MTAVVTLRHGNLGEPGYHKLHPGNVGAGETKLDTGVMIGSPDFSEEDHMAALTLYRDDSHDVNEYLRHKDLPGGSNEKTIRRSSAILDDLIQIQEPSTKPQTVYRGAAKMDLKVGSTFTDRGFVSTSGFKDIAEAFTTEYDPENPGDILEIDMPKGTRSAHVPSFRKGKDKYGEDERILPPGTSFRVVAKTPTGYKLEVVI